MTSIESALRALVEEPIAPLRARIEALERQFVVRDTPLALLSVRALAERHPAYTERALRALIARRHRNGLQVSGAIVRQGRRVLIHERRFVAWAEGMTERPTRAARSARPSVAARRRGGSR